MLDCGALADDVGEGEGEAASLLQLANPSTSGADISA